MKKIFLAAGVLLSFAACTNDAMNDPLADGPVAMTFTAGIDAVATRVNSEGTAFTADDKVGIVPMKDGDVETEQFNVLYTYGSDNRFTANPPYWFQDREMVTFNAYYPYDADLSTNGVIAIDTKAENQTAEEAVAHEWRKNDYLFASNTAEVSNPTVSFTGQGHVFKHVMSKFTLTLQVGDGISDLQALTGYTLGDLKLKGSFDVTTGKVELAQDANAEEIAMTVTPPTGATITCEPLILLPQHIESNKLDLTVHYNGQDYHAELVLPTQTPNNLCAGYHYHYTVKVRNTALEITNASIEGWTKLEESGGEATL